MTKKIWLDENTSVPVRTKLHLDSGDKKIHIENTQDVSPILAENRKLANDNLYKVKGFEDAKMYKVASIPMIVVQQLAKKGIMTAGGRILDRVAFRKWLNDPDNKHFKIYKGTV